MWAKIDEFLLSADPLKILRKPFGVHEKNVLYPKSCWNELRYISREQCICFQDVCLGKRRDSPLGRMMLYLLGSVLRTLSLVEMCWLCVENHHSTCNRQQSLILPSFSLMPIDPPSKQICVLSVPLTIFTHLLLIHCWDKFFIAIHIKIFCAN